MNDHNAMTVEAVETRADRQIVELSSSTLLEELERLPPGAQVRIEMEPLPGRGNCWRATAVRSVSAGKTGFETESDGETTDSDGDAADLSHRRGGVQAERAPDPECERLLH